MCGRLLFLELGLHSEGMCDLAESTSSGAACA